MTPQTARHCNSAASTRGLADLPDDQRLQAGAALARQLVDVVAAAMSDAGTATDVRVSYDPSRSPLLARRRRLL